MVFFVRNCAAGSVAFKKELNEDHVRGVDHCAIDFVCLHFWPRAEVLGSIIGHIKLLVAIVELIDIGNSAIVFICCVMVSGLTYEGYKCQQTSLWFSGVMWEGVSFVKSGDGGWT